MTNNFIPPNPAYEQYRRQRGLMLTRVSTGSQSHDAQERIMREQIIEPLEIVLDDRIVHDTYTGLDYRYRTALDDILRRAEHKEFEVLCVEAIDRGLGRGAIGREVFLGQLWDLGINVLSTDPNDHVNDKSPEGMLTRVMHGYKDEKEVADFVRRVKNAKRNKALGNPQKGVKPRVIGSGTRPYGYKYIRDKRGKIENLELNYDVVLIDRKGVEWSEVRVVIFIFRCLKRRITVWNIVKRLNDIGIPCPTISTGRKYTPRGVKADKPIWQTGTISRMARNTTYSGRRIENGERNVKVPGKKYPRREKTALEEQIVVPVPAIVSVEMQEEVIQNLQKNQQFAMRNNQQKVPALMRSGLAKCGNCGRTALAFRKKEGIYYRCSTYKTRYECKGCYTSARIVDTEAWNVALEIIQNPTSVDDALKKKKEKDPTAARRKQIEKELTKIQTQQSNLRKDLVRKSAEGTLDYETEVEFNSQIKELKNLEHRLKIEKSDDEAIMRKWEKTQRELEHLHQKCKTMQEKLKDPSCEPSYKDKRDMIEYFGMTAILWESGHVNTQTGQPERVKIEARFADIDLRPS